MSRKHNFQVEIRGVKRATNGFNDIMEESPADVKG